MHELLSGVLALGLAIPAATGPDTEGLQSQAQARQLIDAAVAAIGGEETLRSIRSVRRDYTEDWVEVGQGPRPWTGTPPPDELAPHPSFDDSEMLSFIDYAGSRFYLRARYADSANDYGVFADAVTPERAFQVFTYVRERSILTERTQEEGEALRLRTLREYPEGILRMALDRPESLLSLGQTDEDGTRCDLLALTDTQGTQILLYLDAHSHRLLRAETRRGHRVLGDTTADVVYGDWRRVGSLELPYAWTTRVGGVPASRFQARSIQLDAPAEEEWFRTPAEYALAETSPPVPKVEPLGLGLYLIRASYNLTFAEFADQVLLVEAPSGEAFMEEALALIESTIPGKPVRVVATHFHFDHIGGVRTAVAHGIPVLTTPDAAPVIERSLASHQAMRPDALTRAPRAVKIEVVPATKVIDDGSQRVELYDFGPTPHVAQLLVAYYPRQKLLHVADLFDTLTTELVFAGADAEVMYERIRELGLDVERIVPTHGVPVTMRHLERAMEIRRQYREGAR
jgi:glyoxylase-like metal-dependent hydrolase (beta-lactamase superfamily II)